MHHYMIELTSRRFFIMDVTDYWSFAHEYSMWYATAAALQFWTADLDPQTLDSTYRGCIQPFSTVTLHSTCDMLKKKYYSVTL